MDDELVGTERSMFDALENESTFTVLCRRVGVEPLSGARTVQHLRLQGAVRAMQLADEEAEVDGSERRGDDEAVRACVRSHIQLLAEFAMPIVALEGGEGVRTRLIRVAQEASRRYPELLADLVVGQNGVPDPEVLTERALAFPGEREREVRSALGELVSYLEFELLNHPKIDDPEEFVQGMEELRATL